MSRSPGRRRVLVTGASRGIGRVVAGRLAADGADVVLAARDAAALAGVVSELEPGDHDTLPIDVRDEWAWHEARGRIAPDGRLHGVVTAAALVTPVGPIGRWAVADFRTTLEVNVVGTLLAVSTALDFLKAGRGSIVTFSGGGATSPLARFDAYAASKAAVVRLTENLALELRPHGVRANSVAPGFVVTGMHDATLAAGPDVVGPEYYERTRRAVADGSGDSPELAADLVAFLLSDDASSITGKLLSARWDPWRDPEFRVRLESDPDLATLRRIDEQFFSKVPAPRA
jgi:NAD(P)-dependent dehydrogenase (short-subunit alcohol dehydrogenase family)